MIKLDHGLKSLDTNGLDRSVIGTITIKLRKYQRSKYYTIWFKNILHQKLKVKGNGILVSADGADYVQSLEGIADFRDEF